MNLSVPKGESPVSASVATVEAKQVARVVRVTSHLK